MTWNQFKNEVEKQMKDQELDFNVEIEYIDIRGDYDLNDLTVVYDKRFGLAI
jgi:hypothetical protein